MLCRHLFDAFAVGNLKQPFLESAWHSLVVRLARTPNNLPLLHLTVKVSLRQINLDSSNQGKPYGNLRVLLGHHIMFEM